MFLETIKEKTLSRRPNLSLVLCASGQRNHERSSLAQVSTGPLRSAILPEALRISS